MLKISDTLLKPYAFQFHPAIQQISLLQVSAKTINQQNKFARTICLQEYLSKENITAIDIFCSKKQVSLPFKTTPIHANSNLYKNNFQHPDTYYTCLSNVVVRNNSSIIYKDGLAIIRDLIQPQLDIIPEEHRTTDFKVGDIEHHSASVSYEEDGLADFELEDAVLFADSVAANYAHWLTEVLPKIFLVNDIPGLEKIPFIINNNLHPNLMISLALATQHPLECISLMPNTAIKVKNLHVISCIGYVPFENRVEIKEHSERWSGHFSSLLSRYNQLYEAVPTDTLQSLQQVYPTHDKIYIKRNAKFRNVLNAQELENFFYERGFQIVEPEKLSFLEQMYLFRNAKVIVGATGAAFGNLVFSQSGCKVYIFASEQILHMVSYWANITKAVGNLVQIHYIVGTSVDWESDEKFHDQHKNFTININDLSFFR